MRVPYLIAGFFSFFLGLLGAFLPVLPSTCFFILGAYCFGKSSPRLESWILKHPQFGPPVQAWRKHKAMSSSAKLAAYIGIFIGQISLFFSNLSFIFLMLGSLFLIGSAIFIYFRPTYRTERLDNQ